MERCSATDGVVQAMKAKQLERKVHQLENMLKTFRAEVGMKMKIVEQVLNTRNEQFRIQKRLLEREQLLYETVLTHWSKTSELANNGLTLNFSHEVGDSDSSHFDPDFDPLCDKDSRIVITTQKRVKLEVDDNPLDPSLCNNRNLDFGSQLPMSPSIIDTAYKRFRPASVTGNDEQVNYDHDEEYSDNEDLNQLQCDGVDVGFDDTETSGGAEGDVDIDSQEQYNNEDGDYELATQNLTRSKGPLNPIWWNFSRAMDGNSALCKICEKVGRTRWVRTFGGTTSGLHSHLKSGHNLKVQGLRLVTIPDCPRSSKHETEKPKKPTKPRAKSARSSIVWNYFVKTAEPEFAKCTLCEAEGIQRIVRVRGGSTSLMHNHLRSHKNLPLLQLDETNLRDMNSEEGNSETDLDPEKSYNIPMDSDSLGFAQTSSTQNDDLVDSTSSSNKGNWNIL